MTLEISKDGKEGVLRGHPLGYVQVAKPARGQKADDVPKFAAEAFLDTATQKEFKKMFPKTSLRTIPNDEIRDRFKIDPPYPDQGVQYVVSIRQKAVMQVDNPKDGVKAGDPVPHHYPSRPKVYEPVNGVGKDITHEKGVGVGSVGDITFTIRHNDGYGNNPDLKEVLVTEMVAYAAKPKVGLLGIPLERAEPQVQRQSYDDAPAQRRVIEDGDAAVTAHATGVAPTFSGKKASDNDDWANGF